MTRGGCSIDHRPDKACGGAAGMHCEGGRESRVDFEHAVAATILSAAEDHVDADPSAGPLTPRNAFQGGHRPPGELLSPRRQRAVGEGFVPQSMRRVAAGEPLSQRGKNRKITAAAEA